MVETPVSRQLVAHPEALAGILIQQASLRVRPGAIGVRPGGEDPSEVRCHRLRLVFGRPPFDMAIPDLRVECGSEGELVATGLAEISRGVEDLLSGPGGPFAPEVE